MSRKIRVAVIGAAGAVAGVCINALNHRKAEIVAGVELVRVGEDLGEVAGVGRLGVAMTHSDDLEQTIKATKPDVVVDCTLNTLPEIASHAKISMENGANFMPVGVITYHPFFTDPELAKELDAIGKHTGATYLGSGSAELWESLPAAMSAAAHDIKSVNLTFNALLDGFGEGSAHDMGIGSAPGTWQPYIDSALQEASPWEHVERLLAERFGFTPASYEREYIGLAAKDDLTVEGGMLIKKGFLVGFADTATIYTHEGADFTATSYFKYGESGETNTFTIRIEGKPNFNIVIDDFHGDIATSTIMVNRIPDLMYAPGGVALLRDLPVITYKGENAFIVEN